MASSDDWGTPSPPLRKPSAGEEDAVYIVDKVEGEQLDREKNTLRWLCGGKFRMNPVEQAGRGSHLGSASSRRGDCEISAAYNSHSLLLDTEHPSYSFPAADKTQHFQSRDSSPGLFVSEDEGRPVVKNKTYLNPLHNTLQNATAMDGLKRARATKAEIENNISVLKPLEKQTNTRCQVTEDPDNVLIKTLHEEQEMGWKDIANFLNQERRSRNEAANFNPSSVYSRFVMSATHLATSVGEIGFDTKDYMHLRNPNQYTNGKGTGTVSKAGKKRVKNYESAKELEANVRKQIKEEEKVELETPEKTEQLMKAVAKVERNFWIFVADEMERSTTRMYSPSVLADRYHAV
jgi:signal recognition particle subunit SEC65